MSDPTPLQRAWAEVSAEDFRERVEQYKAQIRATRASHRWWHWFIPFTVEIKRRGQSAAVRNMRLSGTTVADGRTDSVSNL